MYSILFSSIEDGLHYVKKDLQKIIKPTFKVGFFPWAFKEELDELGFEEYFNENTNRYQRYIKAFEKIGIKKNNIIIVNCYKTSTEDIRKILKEIDVIFLPGGNPEMMFKKVVQDKELLYDFKHTDKIVVGESAGAELQLTRYFITAKNNFYKYLAFYDGLGIINASFCFDVHSKADKDYLNDLQKIADEKNKNVYAIFDDGALVYNRKDNVIKTYGHTELFTPGDKNDR